jgi:hypothetical protein
MVVQRSEGAVRPLIRANVAGHPLLLLVDTGAAQSLLPAGFVRKFKVPSRSTTANPWMMDVNGHMQSMPRVPDVPVQFEGETSVELVDFLENETDGSETEGILTPQDLVRSGWALVIDLEHDELRYEPEEGALKRLGGPAWSLKEIDYRRCELDNHRVTSARHHRGPHFLAFRTMTVLPSK